MVEARTGRTVREIFETDGEAAYRPLETDALLDALASPEPAVIAAAGGVVLAEANRKALRERQRPRGLAAAPTRRCWRDERCTGDHRPLLDDDPEGNLAPPADRSGCRSTRRWPTT